MATLDPLVLSGGQAAVLRRRVLSLALPAVGEQVLNTLVGLADTFLVGHLSLAASVSLGYSSATALAGVGLASWLIWVMTVLFIAVSVGSTALIARARGANDMQSAQEVLRQSLIVGLLMGGVAMIVGEFGAVAGLRLLGAAPEVIPLGVTFLRIVSFSLVPAALLFIGAAALRGAGDTRTPLYVMLGVNVVNIVLSWLFINGNAGAPTLGVAGTALGAAVARGGGGLVLMGVLLRGRSGLRLSLSVRPHWGVLWRIFRIGAPSGAEQLVFQGALLFFVRFVTGLGTIAYAAHNVVINIESLSFLPGTGYAIAATTLVGQRLGAGRPDEAQAGAYEALRQGLLMMSLLGLFMVLFPHQLIGLFVADPAVADVGASAMRIAGLVQPLLALNFILSGGLRGAGDTRWPLYTKIVSTWGVRLPMVVLFTSLGLGLTGVWCAMAADFIVQAGFAWWRFRGGRWKNIRL